MLFNNVVILFLCILALSLKLNFANLIIYQLACYLQKHNTKLQTKINLQKNWIPGLLGHMELKVLRICAEKVADSN